MTTRGFALAELLMVLAIGGTLAALIAPTLFGYAKTAALQAAARELATSMNLGRHIAISRNTAVCVEVASATSIRLRTGGCSGAVWTGPGTDASGAIAISSAGVTRVSTTANVVFTSLGAASPGGTYMLTGPSGAGARSVVVAATGRVSVR